MKKLNLCLLALFSALTISAAPLFEGTCDKDALSYKIGEKIKFTVKLADEGKPIVGKTVRYSLRDDEGKTKNGTYPSDQIFEIETSLSKPGFTHLTLQVLDEKGKPDSKFCPTFNGGACANFDEIKQALPEPKDFDAYWKNRVSEFNKAPIKANLTPIEAKSSDKVDTYIFSVDTIGKPARGYITIPKNAKPKSLKILASYQGYGWATPNPNPRTDAICISMCSHSVEIGKDKNYYEDLKNGELKNFAWEKELSSPSDSYFDGMLMRDLAALRFAKSLPAWNGKDIVVSGGSMGGFQSIAMAALDNDVSKLSVGVPWMGDLGGKSIGRLGGWLPKPLAARLYFDTINFAKRVKCPMTILVGLGDYVCPPSGEASMYNSIKAPVKITFVQDGTHSMPKHKTARYVRQKN